MGLEDREYIKINNEVTQKSLINNRTDDIKNAVMERFEYVYDMCKFYLAPSDVIVDLGCKDAMFFDLLKEKGHDNLIAVECEPLSIQIAEAKGYVVHEGDIQEMPFLEDNSADHIFIIHTLEHVPNPEMVLDECRRILKRPGFLFIEIPIQNYYEAPEDWGHYHPFKTKEQFKEMVQDFVILDERSQDTPSRKPWYRILLKKIGD